MLTNMVFLDTALTDPAMLGEIGTGILESVYMTFASTLFSYILGLPLGVLLVVTDKDGIMPKRWLNRILGIVINVFRSVPFLILLVMVLPFTRFLLGTTIGSTATVVPLVIAATPFIARLVESSLKEVDKGVIEAAQAMGTPDFKIITKVLLPEARPSLIIGAALALTTILSYSAMAGFVGGGGLGTIAINYGYYKYNDSIMLATVALLVIIVQVMQTVGMRFAKKLDKRK